MLSQPGGHVSAVSVLGIPRLSEPCAEGHLAYSGLGLLEHSCICLLMNICS
jgi:hypothetical protein